MQHFFKHLVTSFFCLSILSVEASSEDCRPSKFIPDLETLIGVCNIIREYNSAKDMGPQLEYFIKQHNLSKERFFSASNYYNSLVCFQKNFAFAAMENEREDFQAIVDTGLDLNRHYFNLDGGCHTPLDYAFNIYVNQSDNRLDQHKYLKTVRFIVTHPSFDIQSVQKFPAIIRPTNAFEWMFMVKNHVQDPQEKGLLKSAIFSMIKRLKTEYGLTQPQVRELIDTYTNSQLDDI